MPLLLACPNQRKPQHATLSSHPPPSKPYCVGITPALAKQRPQLGSESFFYAAAWPRKLFLWASEGNVQRRAPPSNVGSWWPVRAHRPRPQTFLQAAAWPRKLFLASEGNVRDPRAPPPNPSQQLAGLPPFLQAAAWLRKLFLWASEGNVRDPRAPPPNPSRQLAGVPLLLACPRQRKPQHATLSSHPRLQSPTASASLLHWPNKGRSLAQKAFSMPQLGPKSFFYGLPKATLETHGPRPQTLLGSRQACRGLSVACPKPAPSLRPPAPPANVPAWPRKLVLWASEGDVRDPRAPPSNTPRQPAGLPRPLCGLAEACLFSSPTGPARKRSCRLQLGFSGLPKATLDTHGPRPPAAASLWPVRSLQKPVFFVVAFYFVVSCLLSGTRQLFVGHCFPAGVLCVA